MGAPKNYLMAWVLVMLKERNLHGYEIMKTLKARFDVDSGKGAVYRALRQLEEQGYIASWWDPQEVRPARRMYILTQHGRAALMEWGSALQEHRANLDAFFSMYDGELDTA
jgi:poly-beta-hydroxybutyrate-responsive repressor